MGKRFIFSLLLICTMVYLGYVRLVTDWIGFVDDAIED